MEEADVIVANNIKVSGTFKKLPIKDLINNVNELNKKNDKYCNNLSKDFENNRNNSYNIDNDIDNDVDFYFEDEKINILSSENKSNYVNTLLIDNDGLKEEVLSNIGENLGYHNDDFEIYSKKQLNINKERNLSDFKYSEKDKVVVQEKSKDVLLESKNSFDIGNIYDRDYNDETINSKSLIDVKKDLVCDEKNKKNEYLNDNKSFYELNVDDRPDRRNLLKELYEENLVEKIDENGAKKQKTKDKKRLVKYLKGVKNNNEDEKRFR